MGTHDFSWLPTTSHAFRLLMTMVSHGFPRNLHVMTSNKAILFTIYIRTYTWPAVGAHAHPPYQSLPFARGERGCATINATTSATTRNAIFINSVGDRGFPHERPTTYNSHIRQWRG